MADSDAGRTATQTLIDTLEDFSTSEPKDCLVIYTNENGELCWSASTDSMVIKFGLLEACKQFMIVKMAKDA